MLSPLPQRPSLLLWSSSSLRKPYVSARVLTLVKFTSNWMFGCLWCPYDRPLGMVVSIHKSIIMVIIISVQALCHCTSAYTCVSGPLLATGQLVLWVLSNRILICLYFQRLLYLLVLTQY